MCNTCPRCRRPWHLQHFHFKSALLLLTQAQKNNSSPLFKFYGPSEFSSKASCPSGLPLSSTPAFPPPLVQCPGLPDPALLPWSTFLIHMELTMTEEEGWVHSVVSRVQRSGRIDPNKLDHLFQIQHTPHSGTNRSAVPSQTSGLFTRSPCHLCHYKQNDHRGTEMPTKDTHNFCICSSIFFP